MVVVFTSMSLVRSCHQDHVTISLRNRIILHKFLGVVGPGALPDCPTVQSTPDELD